MRARYYSPDLKRFVNADIVIGAISDSTSLNRYAYVNGNPVSSVDPFGLCRETTVNSLSLEEFFELQKARSIKLALDSSNPNLTFDELIKLYRSFAVKNALDTTLLDDQGQDHLATQKYNLKLKVNPASISSFDSAIDSVLGFFNPKTNTIGGSFQDGIFFGSGSLTAGYSDGNIRLQINSKGGNSNGLLGAYGKISVGNASGKIGVGNDDFSVALKSVGDVLTASGQAGVQYKDGLGVGAKAKASVASGRATIDFNIAGWEVEVGVSGDFLTVGGEAMFGYFPDEGFTSKFGFGTGLFGGGFVLRVKPD